MQKIRICYFWKYKYDRAKKWPISGNEARFALVYYIYTWKNEKKMKSEISWKTNIKSFSYELGTWISILEQSYSSNSFWIYMWLKSYIFMTLIIYFYDIEFICFIQIEYQNESYYKITLDYCINIFMILIKYLNYRANTV